MRAVPHGKEGKVEVIDRKTITAVIFCGLILKNVHCMAWSVSSILQCGGKGEVIDSRTITEDEERAIWSSKQILRPLLRHGWLKTWKRWQTNLLKKKGISGIVLETDYVIEDQEKGGKVGLTKRAAEFFAPFVRKGFLILSKYLVLVPLLSQKGPRFLHSLFQKIYF